MAISTDEYLQALPENQRLALESLRQTISQALPEAVESMSTNVPAFRYKDKYLVSFSAAKNHVALLVMQGNAMESLKNELKGYNTGSRIIRFTPSTPLPKGLVKRIIKFRQAEIDER